MKVICDRSALLSAVTLVAGVVSMRSPRPALSAIKFSAQKGTGKGAGGGVLTLSGTDAEISLRLSRTQVEVQEAGEVLIPADRLRSIVTAEENEPTLTIEAEDQGVVIKGRDAKFRVYGFPVADFPPIPEFPAADAASDSFTVNAGQLQQLITRTIFSVARDNSRYAINGVLFKRQGKKLEMVATDGRRLALARGTTEGSAAADRTAQCIIPTKALSMASKLINDTEAKVRIAVTPNQVLFSFDEADGTASTVLSSNLVEGTFPPYEDVIPKDQDKRAKFDVGLLASAVRRAAILTSEETRGIRMAFSADKGSKVLRMSSRNPEMGEADIDVEVESYEGGDIEIGFNPAFLSDALKVMPEQHVILELKAANRPGLIKSGNDFMYVVMPVNLQ
jgi:DNA polymerase-3 subunit beta